MLNFCYGRFLRTGLLHICQGGLNLVDPALGKETRLNNLLSFLVPFARVQYVLLYPYQSARQILNKKKKNLLKCLHWQPCKFFTGRKRLVTHK